MTTIILYIISRWATNMKDSIIKSLFFAIENFDGDGEYNKLFDNLVNSEELLLKEIKDDKEILKAFNKFKEDMRKLDDRANYLYFSNGLKSGVQLTFEILENKTSGKQ